MKIHKRLDRALSYLSPCSSAIYDLFCDHGKLGMECLERGHIVYFNDVRNHLLEGIQKKLPENENSFFLKGEAQKLEFLPGALIFMLGVGGHLMIDCLEQWRERGQLEGREFVIIPTYYPLEIRIALQDLGATALSEDFIWENGHGHELMKVAFKSGNTSNISDFNTSFWLKASSQNPDVECYLQKRIGSLSKKRRISPREKDVLEQMSEVVAKINKIK